MQFGREIRLISSFIFPNAQRVISASALLVGFCRRVVQTWTTSADFQNEHICISSSKVWPAVVSGRRRAEVASALLRKQKKSERRQHFFARECYGCSLREKKRKETYCTGKFDVRKVAPPPKWASCSCRAKWRGK